MAAVTAGQLPTVRLGEAAPDVILPGAGERLSAACARGFVALVLLPSDPAAAAAVKRSVAGVQAKGSLAGTVVEMIGPAQEEARRAFFGSRAEAVAGAMVLLIDRSRVLRRVSNLPADALESTGPHLADLFESFQSGKLAYESACARCHGTDGKNRDYAGIKSLGGVGNRLTLQQITERFRAVPLGDGTFSVRTCILTRKGVESLAHYVAGL
ncbi:MAG: cytochrome c [Bryobacteraceae bacterium]